MNRVKVGAISFKKKPSSFSVYLERVNIFLEKLKREKTEIVLLPGNIGGIDNLTEREWFLSHQEMAKRFRLFIIPGPIRNIKGELGSVVFSSGGAEVGRQGEINSGKKRRIEVFPTEYGKIALAIGKDLYSPEYGRILAGMGADIVFAPVDEDQRFGGWRWGLSGMWREVQQNQFWGIEACCEIRPGGIFAPCEATTDRTGILKKGWGPISTVLYEEKRSQARDTFPVTSQLSSSTIENFLSLLLEGD